MTELSRRYRIQEWFDRQARALAAGMGLAELRALLRGQDPTERPNPRYKAHTNSFLLHIRPRYYQNASTWFTHTFRLGFMTAFLFLVEIITGFLLMIYYVPTPEDAYASILRLRSQAPYGELLRDVHRLAAEGMVIFAFLHMVRTFFTASYKRERSFTWLTGVLLLLITLLLSFSGYLLPWDQLAYWAVTIGTSMVTSVPLVGQQLNLLLRGSESIGADGLLRFYQLHVIVLPLAAILLVSVHYYRVARKHSISLPARVEEGDLSSEARQAATRRIDWLPDLLLHEAFLVSVGLLALAALALFAYDAPLERHANPLRTPLETEAPWFFLWVQGLLKLGNRALMGVFLPAGIVLLLLAVPYLDRNPYRLLRRRPLAVTLGAAGLVGLAALTYLGTAEYGINLPPAARISQELAPEEGIGPLHRVPFDALVVGVYQVDAADVGAMPAPLAEVFDQYQRQVQAARDAGELPEAQAFMIVEDWQQDLKRVTLRITWLQESTEAVTAEVAGAPPSTSAQTLERTVYLHRNRGTGDSSQ
jgi:quinol-cytochrome oxidoreductase complex cytochrome b subunit